MKDDAPSGSGTPPEKAAPDPDPTGAVDRSTVPEASEWEDEVPAPAWARLLLAVTPFVIAALVLLGLRLLNL